MRELALCRLVHRGTLARDSAESGMPAPALVDLSSAGRRNSRPVGWSSRSSRSLCGAEMAVSIIVGHI